MRTPGLGVIRAPQLLIGPSSHLRPARPPEATPRWPTTRAPASSSFSAATTAADCARGHLDLERLELDRAVAFGQPVRPKRRLDGLRPGHRPARPLRRQRRQWPARGHLDLGRLELDRAVAFDEPARAKRRLDGLRPGHGSARPLRRQRRQWPARGHLDLGRLELDRAVTFDQPARPKRRLDGYDPGTGQLVLFGGNDGSGPLADTWTWDGSNWTEQSPSTSPSARSDASMAYDPGTGQLVLFGGNDGSGPLADTWTWDGSNWTEQSPATSPPARSDASMSYDPGTGQLVLFGGNDGQGVFDGDTWSFSLVKASQSITFVSSAPSSASYSGSNNQTYVVNATASSGLPLRFSIDSSSTSGCTISGLECLLRRAE